MKTRFVRYLIASFAMLCIYQYLGASPVYRPEVSNHCILDIKQDSCGFVWVATANGLCKSLDVDYEIFFTDPADEHSIPSNQIKALYTDSTGRLWITTSNGVCAKDSDSNLFTRYSLDGYDDNFYGLGFIEFAGKILFYGGHGLYTLNTNDHTIKLENRMEGEAPKCVIIGPDDQLWVTNGNTLMALDKRLTPTVRLQFNNEQRVETMATDGQYLLLGTPSGIKRFNPKDLTSIPTAIGADTEVNHILPMGDGKHLVSTSNRGVLVYDSAKNSYGKQYSNIDFTQIPTEEINRVFVDRDKNVWVATFDKGVVRFTDRPSLFNGSRNLIDSFRNEFATRIQFDNNGNMWVGTRYNGIAFYDLDKERMTYLNSNTVSGLSDFSNDFVQSLMFDSRGRLWVGYSNSLIVCQPYINGTDGDNLLSVIKKFPSFTSFVCLSEDSKGRVWACTDNHGLYVIDKDLNVVHTIGTPVVRSNNITKVIPYDEDHMLFSVYNDNVYLVDINNMTVKNFIPDRQRKLENVIDMMFDKSGNLWLGTYNHGLLRYDTKAGELTTCLGSQTDDMVALSQDSKGDIWASSSYGIYRYDNLGNLLNSYQMRDGLGGNQFHEKCVASAPNGKIFFGGNAGIEEVAPANHAPADRTIPLYLTRVWLMPERVPALTGDLEGRAEHSVKDLTLDHDDSSINLEFFGVDYDTASYIEYAYKLEGHDDDFFNLGTYNSVTYSNLAPGKYRFLVKARFKDGEWQEPVELLSVKVKPSPWLTPWAIIIYIAVFIAIVYFANRAYLRLRLARHRYALANERVEQEKRIAANKLNFFTNISHELRTPLTLICGPAKHLRSNFKSMSEQEVQESMDFIDNNIDRLLTLINQLLNFRKVNNETLPLKVNKADIGKHLEAIAAIYRIYAGENGIKLHLELPQRDLNVVYDSDKLEKIVSNLIVNAIKYSPEKGDINMKLELAQKPEGIENPGEATYAMLSVTDNGKGVEESDIPKIFQPFKRLFDSKEEKKAEGFGIGLHFVVELVKEHKGVIRATKNPGGGMTFTAIFPVSEDAFEPQEYLNVDTQSIANTPPLSDLAIEENITESTDTASEEQETERPTLLIVEDNEALNAFLQNLFKDKYNIISTYNGDEGWQKAFEECPDIVISDILMPGEIDGIELCRRIRNNEATSHIPVILMTAKAMDESKIEGFNSGADAYICKPFNPDVLTARVDNLVDRNHNRKELLLANIGKADPETVATLPNDDIAPLDKKFLEKLYAYIDNSLDNCDLNVNLLGRELGYSRTNFYRKVKALTGVSPNDLLRVYRLNRAAELLLTREYTIGEVGEKTGFGNQSHFSSLFKKHFGISPRAYVSDHFGN